MRRSLAILVVATALVPTSSQLNLFDSLWSFVSSLWGGADLAKAGCSWDPNGRACS